MASIKELVDVSSLRVGQRVRSNSYGSHKNEFLFDGEIIALKINDFAYCYIDIKRDDGVSGGGFLHSWRVNINANFDGQIFEVLSEFKSKSDIKSDVIPTKETTTMNLLGKLRNSMRMEPQKTYVKLGVTNGDGSLTEDGRKAFIDHLFTTDHQSEDSAFYKILKKLDVDEDKK